jgi:hypothetical protein
VLSKNKLKKDLILSWHSRSFFPQTIWRLNRSANQNL